ncbi:MAG TPA: MFS transporter [Candidatus Limnocylindrales bacterium]|nr:MFS transporter [Candidatus Limnocylindrales bacterium]
MSLVERLTGARLLQPLRHRDFALLAGGSVVSLLGDGFFFVALTWQVYTISNVPTALSLVGVAWTLPSVVLLLFAGAFSDRHDRRRLMIAADLVRAAAIGSLAILSASGRLELWHVAGLIAFVGAGDAFFNPSSTAIVPDLVPTEELPAANALQGIYRPLMVRLLGPALAGLTVAALGPAPAFAIDAASFLVSALAVTVIRARPPVREAGGVGLRGTLEQVAEGIRYARSTPWIWATLVAAMLALLVFMGPGEVLIPFLVKNRLGAGPETFGAILAVGGVGAIAMSLLVGAVGLPRRRVTAMYGAFTGGVALCAVYGLMTAAWQALVVSFTFQALFMLGQVIWTTMLQQLVPRELLGRVSSLDWLISGGLVPVSFALTGPVSSALGPETTMVGASLLAACLMTALFFLPGVRDPERSADLRGAAAEGAFR